MSMDQLSPVRGKLSPDVSVISSLGRLSAVSKYLHGDTFCLVFWVFNHNKLHLK